MQRLLTAVVLIFIASAAQAETRFPNRFAFFEALNASLPGAERYLNCDYSTRTCLVGTVAMGTFVGTVVDGDDRTTVFRHIRCYVATNRCEDFDEGVDAFGRVVTRPDMPIACVEEMRKFGRWCQGYDDFKP